MYIYQNNSWPNFIWSNDIIFPFLSKVRNLQGRLIGKMENLGFDLKNEALLETLTLDVLKSTEIEGEFLSAQQVRSSIAKRLGMDLGGLIASDRNVDGMVDLMIDATRNFNTPLTQERLFEWHSSLFPTTRSNMYKIVVGSWRNDFKGPIQVISGSIGKENVHFQAPESSKVSKEMEVFIEWFNSNDTIEPVIKAAIGHLWFVTIHPFEDGNGRITRALTDMLLARSDSSSQRFYSMSAQIRLERKSYYKILESTQKGGMDITEWILWFLYCLINSLHSTDSLLAKVLSKASFWKNNAKTILNYRQQIMINKLLDEFDGKLTTSKWSKITKCSQDTALRDIHDLLSKNILKKQASGGRSTHYELVPNQ
ncbi:MAG: Fic family protein [Saprospiraceae bacterium]